MVGRHKRFRETKVLFSQKNNASETDKLDEEVERKDKENEKRKTH